jgi:hypothetical protein
MKVRRGSDTNGCSTSAASAGGEQPIESARIERIDAADPTQAAEGGVRRDDDVDVMGPARADVEPFSGTETRGSDGEREPERIVRHRDEGCEYGVGTSSQAVEATRTT